MYDNTPPRWANLGCLNRFAMLFLLLITVAWVLYVVLTPPDPANYGLDLVWRRLVEVGLAIAWVSIFAMQGLAWLVDRLH
jgi:hypothetical protein